MSKPRVARIAAAVALVAMSTACGGAPALVGEAVVATPNESAPLSRLLSFTTSSPATATVTISDGDATWTLPPSAATDHRVPVVGLRSSTRYTARIALAAPGGQPVDAATVEFSTDRLPPPYVEFPPIEVPVSEPDRMEPGMTLFSAIRWLPDAEDLENGFLFIVDATGRVVWYFHGEHRISDARLTPRDTIIYQYNHGVVEIDLLGNELAHWRAAALLDSPPPAPLIPVATDVFHHQAIEMADGTILALGTEAREYDNYPTSVTDPDAPRATAWVVGDHVVQFRRDGSIVREWSLLDALDPYRMSYDSLGGFWNREGYEFIEQGTRDWSHGNGVIPDPRDDGIIVTLRHQDAVVKLSGDGDLVWILGDPTGWNERFQPYLLQPEGEVEWPYHLHAPQITPDGNVMVFDNGNFRAVPPDPPMPHADNYSRAVEYAVDQDAMTVRQVWSYGGPGEDSFYSAFLGDADRLPQTGNVLIVDGGHIIGPDGLPTNDVIGGRKWGRLLEVTGGDDPEVVFELVMNHGESVERITGWTIYQATRIPSLR